MPWVLPPPQQQLDNNYNMDIYIYVALNRTPNIDCYWVGAVPKGCRYKGYSLGTAWDLAWTLDPEPFEIPAAKP